jgi:hypothetical protein
MNDFLLSFAPAGVTLDSYTAKLSFLCSSSFGRIGTLMVFKVSPWLKTTVVWICSKSTPAVAVCSDASSSIVLKSTVTVPSLPFFLSMTTSAASSEARAVIALLS